MCDTVTLNRLQPKYYKVLNGAQAAGVQPLLCRCVPN